MAALVRNVQLIEAADKLKQQVERLQRNINYLEGRVKQEEERNLSLSTDLKDFERLKAGLGKQEVKAVIEGQKAAEMCLTVPKQHKKKRRYRYDRHGEKSHAPAMCKGYTICRF